MGVHCTHIHCGTKAGIFGAMQSSDMYMLIRYRIVSIQAYLLHLEIEKWQNCISYAMLHYSKQTVNRCLHTNASARQINHTDVPLQSCWQDWQSYKWKASRKKAVEQDMVTAVTALGSVNPWQSIRKQSFLTQARLTAAEHQSMILLMMHKHLHNGSFIHPQKTAHPHMNN